ncbi:hypothetical protein CASFOL_028591 [Castilleja foliolosa]|uniref:MORF/ORRM1/DAG-like MORF domain-containing protein n=1 Tax=Castilleja foliolosa TaxID=1961234 RepID=A0ABD3CCC9_9LAMI
MAPLFPGCDYEHWLIVMDKPGGEGATKQQMIDCYIQTLAKILGSEEEAKQKIYNVSCERYFGFGCAIDEETSNKLEGVPGVLFVLQIHMLTLKTKTMEGFALLYRSEGLCRRSNKQLHQTIIRKQISMNLEYFSIDSQAFITDHERALEELFAENAEKSRKFDECLNVMGMRIATVCASLKASEKLSHKMENFVSKNKAAQLQQRDDGELSTRDLQKMVQALPQYNEQMEKLSLHVE